MISVSNLTKNYGKVEAVKGISFHVAAGDVYGLLGPNGAGKSTTIGMISGLVKPGSGSIKIGDFDLARQELDAKRILGVVPQQSVVIDELSATQNCHFFGSLYHMDRAKLHARTRELLEWVGLAERAREPVSNFSGGMMRRLTLVLGIIHQPAALVLDEPTVGLDPQTRIMLLDKVAEIAQQGTAVLLTTHYMDEAERLCRRMGIIDEGTIIAEGSLEELRAQVKDVQIFTLRGRFDHTPVEELVGRNTEGHILDEGDGLVVSLPPGSREAEEMLRVASGLEGLSEVTIRPPSLESLFINLTGKALRD